VGRRGEKVLRKLVRDGNLLGEDGLERQSLWFGSFPRTPIVLEKWAGDKVEFSKGEKWSNVTWNDLYTSE
jgi:hypothetical protein